jgi:hypothetical protein
MPQLRRCLGEGKASFRSFRKKKTEAMSPTLVQHFRYSRCEPPHERFAVDVPFAFATSCFRQGHRRYARRTWRREMHRDCWRTRGTSARLRLPSQLTEDSSSIIPHSSRPGNQKPCFKTLTVTPARPSHRMDSDKAHRPRACPTSLALRRRIGGPSGHGVRTKGSSFYDPYSGEFPWKDMHRRCKARGVPLTPEAKDGIIRTLSLGEAEQLALAYAGPAGESVRKGRRSRVSRGAPPPPAPTPGSLPGADISSSIARSLSLPSRARTSTPRTTVPCGSI